MCQENQSLFYEQRDRCQECFRLHSDASQGLCSSPPTNGDSKRCLCYSLICCEKCWLQEQAQLESRLGWPSCSPLRGGMEEPFGMTARSDESPARIALCGEDAKFNAVCQKVSSVEEQHLRPWLGRKCEAPGLQRSLAFPVASRSSSTCCSCAWCGTFGFDIF